MINKDRTLLLSCVCIGLQSIPTVAVDKPITNIQGRKTMTKNQQPPHAWVTIVNQELEAKNGTYDVTKGDTPLILEWYGIKSRSPKHTDLIKQSTDILVQTYVSMERQFAQTHPEAVKTEMFLKPLIPLLSKGLASVDWHKAEQILYDTIHNFFASTDFAQFAGPDDICLFVLAKTKHSKELCGIIQFLVTPEYAQGDVKVGMFGIAPHAEHLGLENVLMSSVFRIIPQVKRLFLHTRKSNKKALDLYRSWGFTPYPGPLPYWCDMEYNTDQAQSLQEVAQSL